MVPIIQPKGLSRTSNGSNKGWIQIEISNLFDPILFDPTLDEVISALILSGIIHLRGASHFGTVVRFFLNHFKV